MDEKIDDTSGATEATAPSARAHHAGDGGAVAGPARRLSAKRKLVAVQRLMRGESLEAVSRDLNVPVHRLSEWRDRVLMAAESALKERERDERDDEIARLQAKVGEITMANELLYAKIDKLEGGRPLARRRSRT
jgi:transposase